MFNKDGLAKIVKTKTWRLRPKGQIVFSYLGYVPVVGGSKTSGRKTCSR